MAYSALQEKVAVVSATQTAQNVTFGFRARILFIRNNGTNSVFVTTSGATATTGIGHEIKANEERLLHFPKDIEGPGGLGLICSNSETATVRVWALA